MTLREFKLIIIKKTNLKPNQLNYLLKFKIKKFLKLI